MRIFRALYVSLAFSVVLSACSGQPKVIENPVSIADNTSDRTHSLKVSRVEFTDTATVLSFRYTADDPKYGLSIGSGAVLSDEKGRTYRTRFFKEKNFDEYFGSTPEGMTLTIGFEPMPSDVRIFDFIEGTKSTSFRIFGIRDSLCRVKAPSYSKKEMKKMEDYRKGFFNPGPATLRGMIEGYDSSAGYNSMSLVCDDYAEGTQKQLMIPLADDGSFERSLDIIHPKSSYFRIKGPDFRRFVYWYVEPGDTLDITIRQDGSEDFALSDGRPYRLARYASSGLTDFNLYPFMDFMSDVDSMSQEEISAKVSGKISQARMLVDYIARKNGFSAYEYTYASYGLHQAMLNFLMDYRMEARCRPRDDFYSNKITYEQYDSLQKVINAGLSDPEQLALLSEFEGADDVVFLSLPSVWAIFNRYQYDPAFTAGKDSLTRTLASKGFLVPFVSASDSLCLENDKRIFHSEKPSFFGKLCVLQDLRERLKYEFEHNDSTGMEVGARYVEGLKTLLNHPALAAKAEWIYKDQIEKMKPYKDIPEGMGKEVLDKILANYPGKYVYLDFWSVGCGPCRIGIETCRKQRPDLMGNNYDSLVVVFITDDKEEWYTPYYEEHLKGAESYRIPHDQYLALTELFEFSAIPHHEFITPTGKACTNVPEMLSLNPMNPEDLH